MKLPVSKPARSAKHNRRLRNQELAASRDGCRPLTGEVEEPCGHGPFSELTIEPACSDSSEGMVRVAHPA